MFSSFEKYTGLTSSRVRNSVVLFFRFLAELENNIGDGNSSLANFMD